MILSDKRHLLIDHPNSLLFYISKYNIKPNTELVQNMYNTILHLLPVFVLDTERVDYERMLEEKTIILSLQKTDEGLFECKEMIRKVLEEIAPYVINVDSLTRLLYVSMITENKLYIEADNLGE